MKRFIIPLFILMHSCINQQTLNIPNSVQELYNQNKGRDFSIFKNWEVYPRESGSPALLFDYYLKDKIEFRFLVIDQEQTLVKQIYPSQDTVFHSIEKLPYDGSPFNQILYENFKSLNVISIKYVIEEEAYLIETSKYSLIYSLKPIDDITSINRFKNYSSIDSYWFYCCEED